MTDIISNLVSEMSTNYCGLTYEEIIIACRNIGTNLDCGGCACLFFTGHQDIDHSDNCTRPDLAHSGEPIVIFGPEEIRNILTGE